MVAPVFLLALLFIFNIGYDLFTESVLDNATQFTARQMQTGHATGAANEADFIKSDFCPNTYGLIDCSEIYVRVEQIDTNSCTDFYDATSGTMPIEGGVLQLGDYGGSGSDVGATGCATANSATGFCNAGPSQAILLSAIYVPPSFMGGLLGAANTVTYNGKSVTPLLATAGFETEAFPATVQPDPC